MSRARLVFVTKLVCANLLLLSFFLPIARGCSGFELNTPQQSAEPDEKRPLFVASDEEAPPKYAWRYVLDEQTAPSSALLFLFFGFLWPWPALDLRRRLRRRWPRTLLCLAELLLCVGTWHAIGALIMFEGALMIGGYLALGSAAVYFLATLVDLGLEIRGPTTAA